MSQPTTLRFLVELDFDEKVEFSDEQKRDVASTIAVALRYQAEEYGLTDSELEASIKYIRVRACYNEFKDVIESL